MWEDLGTILDVRLL